MRNRSQRRPASSHKFLWFVTGVLITLFVCGLTFLKKRVTIVNEGAQGETITIANANSRPALLAASHVNHEISADAKAAAPATPKGDQYDFYTMLPKMQVKQNAPAASTPPTLAKPTKPLDVAEKSMLSPQQVSATATPTLTTIPATAATPVVAPIIPAAVTPPPTPSKFIVTAGSFDDASSADATKAQLLLAGMDQVSTKKMTVNGITKYQVIVGNAYSSKADAKKMLQQVQDAKVSGKIQATS